MVDLRYESKGSLLPHCEVLFIQPNLSISCFPFQNNHSTPITDIVSKMRQVAPEFPPQPTMKDLNKASHSPPASKENEQPSVSGSPEPSLSARSEAPATTLYPKTLKLADFIHAIQSLPEYRSSTATVSLIGSTKLHGTHADILFETCDSNDFRLQSRNQLSLFPGGKDNVGFAAHVATLETEAILRLRDRFVERYRKLNPGVTWVKGEVIIAAEWCGIGDQKKVAIGKVPRFMAIISLFINGEWVPDWEYHDIADEANQIFHVGRAGFFRHELSLDKTKESGVELKRLTDEVDRECPFARVVCGEEGRGEGIVWKAARHCGDPNFWFKTKGDLLAVSNVSKLPAAAVDKENRERVENFAKAIVTEVRLEQGWDYLIQKNSSGTGLFLKWVTDDCLAEE